MLPSAADVGPLTVHQLCPSHINSLTRFAGAWQEVGPAVEEGVLEGWGGTLLHLDVVQWAFLDHICFIHADYRTP